ncbi:MAG: hypothetical protein ACI8W3_001443, partial [Myxococcota bacterium]
MSAGRQVYRSGNQHLFRAIALTKCCVPARDELVVVFEWHLSRAAKLQGGCKRAIGGAH